MKNYLKMKTKIFLAGLFLSLTFISCKKEETKQEEVKPVEKVAENPNAFKVIFEVIAKKDDRFHLYYSEDGTLNFPEDKSLWVDVKGSDKSQEVAFVFPEDIIPSQLRIDFCTNKEQEPLEIKNFKMSYLGKVFEAKGSFFFDYFGPNMNTMTVDKQKAIITPIVKEGQDYAPPSFYPSQEALAAQIKALTQK